VLAEVIPCSLTLSLLFKNASCCIALRYPSIAAGRNLISPRLAVALGLVAPAGGF
jgi:hypothetical protein